MHGHLRSAGGDHEIDLVADLLAEELAERGTLGTRKVVREASPGDPYGGPI